MRLRLLAAAIAVLASSLAAHADTLFTFTATDGTSDTFHLGTQEDSDDTYMSYNTDNFDVYNVDFYSDDYGDAAEQAGFGHLDLRVFFEGGRYYGQYELDGPQLYTGTESAPVFTLGTYNLTSDPEFGVADATLVISDDSVAVATVATAATPEPSSLALLSTGLFGLAGVVRRRLVA